MKQIVWTDHAVDMKVKCTRDVDILSIRLSYDPFDYAEEDGGLITHFSKKRNSVLLEVQGAKEFLLSSITSLIEESEVTLP